MQVYTIGFTKKTAEEFFGLLRLHDVERLVDVRASNTSQLAGFAKQEDLVYFLEELLGVEYTHLVQLAPPTELFRAYRKGEESWETFAAAFSSLLAERRVEDFVPKELFDKRTVLLCSEPDADRCHRRLVVEYLNSAWGDVEAVNL